MMLSISSEAADSNASALGNGRKIGRIYGIFFLLRFWLATLCLAMVRWAFDLKRTDTAMPLGCGAGLSIYNLLRVFD